MKKLILILFTVIVALPLNAQNYLEKQKTINAGLFYDIISIPGTGKMFTARSGDIFISTNTGINWSRYKAFDFGSVRSLARKNSVLYAGLTSGGMWWTDVNSQDWQYSQVRSNPVSGQPASVQAIGIDNSGTIFISTGEYGFFKSANGSDWTLLPVPPGYTVTMNTSYQFTFDSFNNVYVATSVGMYKSTNGGGSWETANSGLTDEVVTSVIHDSNILYCATLSGLFKSTDNAASWIAINNGINDFQLSKIFMTTQRRLYAGSFSGKIFISNDNGQSWLQNQVIPGNDVITGFSSEGSAITVCTQGGGIYRSENGVSQWAPVSKEIGPEYLSSFIKYDGTKNMISLAGTGILFSDDGINWEKRSAGLPSGVSITKLLRIPSGKIFATTFTGDIYFTTDNGLLWSQLQNGFAASDRLTNIFVSNNGMLTVSANMKPGFPFNQRYAKIYTSTDNGESWNIKLNKPLSETKLISVSKQGTMYIAMTTNFSLRDTIFKSTDLGSTWEKVTVNGAANSPAVIKINNNNEDVFVITKNDNKIFRSEAGSGMWSSLAPINLSTYTTITCVEFNSVNKILIGTNNSGIYTSSNTGQSWQVLTNGLYGHSVSGSGYSYAYISSIVIDNNDYMYLTTYEDGLYKSGSSTFVNSGLNVLPGEFYLKQNYPNPFNPTTKIKFDLPKNSFVKINVFDITGRILSEIVNQNLSAGSYEADFNGANLSSGIYYYRIDAGDFTATKKMILVK